jgi:hypothetical protein
MVIYCYVSPNTPSLHFYGVIVILDPYVYDCSLLVSSAVKPVEGDALLFFSLHPDAATDSDTRSGPQLNGSM